MSSKTTQNVNSAVAAIISVSVNIIIVAVVVMCVYTFGTWAYHFGMAVFNYDAVDEYNGRTVVVTIPEGSSVTETAGLMTKAGLVEDKYVFAVQLVLSGHADDIAAGTYTLSTDMTIDEIMDAIVTVSEEEE